MALKAGAALIALVGALTLLADLGARQLLIFSMLLPAIVFFLPDLWLRQRARARAKLIDAEIPEILELLRVAVGAGFGLKRALAEVGSRQHGVLADEFKRAASSLACGETFHTAITELHHRCPTPLITTFIATITRSERHGTPLSEPLATIIQQARANRSRRAMEAAARAAPKIQLVVALLLVPSVMLLITATLLPIFMSR
jgi:tight adherence protein C